jgi:hypothetical protein
MIERYPLSSVPYGDGGVWRFFFSICHAVLNSLMFCRYASSGVCKWSYCVHWFDGL